MSDPIPAPPSAPHPSQPGPRRRGKWPTPSLSVGLPVVMAVLLLLVVVVASVLSVQRGTDLLVQRAEEDLLRDAARLARRVSIDLAERPREVQAEMQLVDADRRELTAVLLDAQGRVRLAVDPTWVGHPVAQVWPDWDPQWWAANQAAGRPVQRRDAAEQTLVTLYPVDVAPGQPVATVVLVQDLRTDVRGLVQRLALNRSVDVMATAGLILLLAAALRRWVARPLQALRDGVSHVAAGLGAVAVPEQGPAEVVELARGFNAMVRALDEARQALQASEQRMALVIDSTGDAMMAVDADLRVTLLNPVAEQLTGWTEAQAQGRAVADVFHIENALTGLPAEFPLESVVREGVVVGLANHTRLVSREGRRTHIADSAAPIRGRDGAVQGAIVVFRDVTEQYELQQALARSEWHYRTLADSGDAMVWTLDLPAGTRWGNANWCNFLGLPVEALTAGWADKIHPDDRDGIWVVWRRAMKARESFRATVRHRRHDGVYRWILLQGAPRYDVDGAFLGFIGHCLDVTDLKEAQEQLQAQLGELQRWHAAMLGREGRVAELKAEVNALARELGQAAPYASVEPAGAAHTAPAPQPAAQEGAS